MDDAAVAAIMSDAVLDVIAIGEAYQAGDAAAAHAILAAWRGEDSLPLVNAAVGLAWRAVAELDEPAAWIAEFRRRALAGELP